MEPTDNLFDIPIVNPFLTIELKQVGIDSVLLEGNQILVSDYESEINLIFSSAGMHLPSSVYNYM